jgi:phytoene/squalene synthetase
MDHNLAGLAGSITKAASQQTYATIRFLVDRGHVDDAYFTYGYFRWVDDTLDAGQSSLSERISFIARQKSLLYACYRGEPLPDASLEEQMLVELVRRNPQKDSGLASYLRNMMLVMDFDAKRRNRLVSQLELNEYTRWLATAVTEAMHYFIGHDCYAPRDETRYLAVSAAHVAHMLRDTLDDVQAGYYNIPREVLNAHHIAPEDVSHPAYRAWIKGRVHLAREYFAAGKGYLARVQEPRCRLAGFAYTARFEMLLDTLERENFVLRSRYDERKSLAGGLRIGWLALSSMLDLRVPGGLSQPVVSRPVGKL